MQFKEQINIDSSDVMFAMGYTAAQPPTSNTLELLNDALNILYRTAHPRWVYAVFPLVKTNTTPTLGTEQLPGYNIKQHLNNCQQCALLAVTLGNETDAAIRTAQTNNMATATLLDSAASILVEQYAGKAQEIIQTEAESQGKFITPRYSPGYGDFPLSFQIPLLNMLDAGRKIGLTSAKSGILSPNKSITALIGVSTHPVSGALAGCENCKLFEGCKQRLEGTPCGTKNTQFN